MHMSAMLQVVAVGTLVWAALLFLLLELWYSDWSEITMAQRLGQTCTDSSLCRSICPNSES